MIPIRYIGHIVAFSAVVTLAACASTGKVGVTSKGQAHAPGLDLGADSVDGLTVGHRLMAAGEYDLALKAYYRAAGRQGLNVDVLSAIGSANLMLGRLGQAEETLRRAIDLDETFPPAWNNLGVALMESGKLGEAERIFRTAFALSNGENPQIRENLSLALAKLENPSYDTENNNTFALVRRGGGEYRLLATP